MRRFAALRMGVLIAVFCLCAHGQEAPVETKGLPPRAAPADYQFQAKAGTVTVAAEFKGHSVPTLQGPLTTEEYIVVETGLFGPPGARTKISVDNFELRVSGKKMPLPSQPFGFVLTSLKDPEWSPPVPAGSKSKTSLSTGGEKSEDGSPPAPVKIPIPVQRAMAQRVQKAALPEGDRSLPVAGLIFFEYRGKTQNIRSIELTYTGPDGKATLTLQP